MLCEELAKDVYKLTERTLLEKRKSKNLNIAITKKMWKNSKEFDFQGHKGIVSIIVFFKSPSVITG